MILWKSKCILCSFNTIYCFFGLIVHLSFFIILDTLILLMFSKIRIHMVLLNFFVLLFNILGYILIFFNYFKIYGLWSFVESIIVTAFIIALRFRPFLGFLRFMNQSQNFIFFYFFNFLNAFNLFFFILFINNISFIEFILLQYIIVYL